MQDSENNPVTLWATVHHQRYPTQLDPLVPLRDEMRGSPSSLFNAISIKFLAEPLTNTCINDDEMFDDEEPRTRRLFFWENGAKIASI